MTVPTTLPRFSGAARVAAKGTRICATTEKSPVRAVPTSTMARVGARAVVSSPAADRRAMTRISPRRSNRSPSGTMNSNPAA